MSTPTMTALAPQAPAPSAREDRSAKVAVTVFPLIILGALVGGLIFPDAAAPLLSGVNYALMVIMFGMGLTLTLPDFAVVARRPWPIILGVLLQFIVMPLSALFVTWAFHLDPALAVGVILVGCAPGGTASNVVAYLAKGDVALSVAMTSVSTLLSPLVTPILTKYLAGQYMPVDAPAMAKSIMMIVFIPVVLGLIVRRLMPRFVATVLPALPWMSVLGISYAVLGLVGASSERILSGGLLVLAVVIVHNALGLGLGYGVARISGVGESAARTTAIEVGMQNSGLAAGLGAQYFTPEAAVPGAIFSVWHNVSGSALAAFFQRRPLDK
ncbi:bile acid:sodium symporter family protein [Pauljensenia sp. OF14-1SRA]|uniref:bile acid:sodium symporter family protein n=1 Tax=Pauljensenia sp. OF14-1SRA TaxID=2998062 RepID=UPI0022E224A1|nr:bile acid:sodium symporter family protein [Pauljensenia sp. OF14-1SRA]